MTKFITGKNLENAVFDIIGKAKKILLIVSPYIKLDKNFENHFDIHFNCPNVHILLVFGKNENNLNRSMSKFDLDYFKKFTNISIIYVSNLHAKYYGNEKNGLITSINLYDYSFKNNIEYGVFSSNNLLQKFLSKTDDLAWQTSIEIAQKGEAIFIKRPVYQNKFWFSPFGRNYVKSDVLFDITEGFYSANHKTILERKKLNDFPDKLNLNENKYDFFKEKMSGHTKYGYCIRTGKSIPFNLDKPFSYQAYSTWSAFNNPDYKENYCHLTGKESNGKTSMRRPIL